MALWSYTSIYLAYCGGSFETGKHRQGNDNFPSYSLPSTLSTFRNRDSSVGIAVGYGLDDRGSRIRFPAGAGNFLFTTRPERLWCPPMLLSNGISGSFPEGKAAGA
jgi:hypothetical protein